MLASRLFALLDSVYPTGPVETTPSQSSSDGDNDNEVDALLMAEEAVSTSACREVGTILSTSPLLCEVRPVPGKGLGLVATTSISAGALILSEAPLIKLSTHELGFYRLQWEADRVSPSDKANFYQLHHTGMDELPSVLEIWRKNSFATTSAGSSSGSNESQAVFKMISRINNSCNPNCSVSWDEEHNKMNVYAVKDIEENVEIQLCYVNLLLSRNQRHDLLYEQWEFDCRCGVCSGFNPWESQKGDNRRRRVAWIGNELDYGYQDVQKGLNLVEEGLKLLEEEQLPTERLSLSWFGYQYAAMHSRNEEAKYYAALAYEHSKLMNGENHNATVLARRGMVEPVFYKSQAKEGSMLGGCLIS